MKSWPGSVPDDRATFPVTRSWSAAGKKAMIERVTDAALSVESAAFRPVTWVIVEEVPSGAWGIAGRALTTESARQIVTRS